MFVVSSPRRMVTLLLICLLTSLTLISLTGCGEKEVVDPYAYDSIRRIMKGDTLSVNFLFEIDAPEFDYVKGDVAIIRNGNRLDFLIGEDIENNYRNLAGTLLGVRKSFSPQPTHLVIERIKRGGVIEADSLVAPTGYMLPTLLRAGAIDIETPGAPLPDIGWKRKDMDEARATFLPENEDDPPNQFQSAIANFAYMPRPVQEEGAEVENAWYAIFDECSVELVELTPGAEWMLEMFLEKELPLVGCFSVMSLEEEYSKRKIEHETLGHLVGTVKVNWFRFGNTFVQGTAAE